ncbi:hypothetical protein [Rhizobium leguminosarum]|uniref:hypothetical protein n=1 Tax=Rhizobium leguminosarum TaxID=384 RepID=UPI001C94DBC0|nr:hypothetical protein [Rhizobium leguminosarum]MBY5462072.1 hypothetical protein [Rhizobium leguminosarum]
MMQSRSDDHHDLHQVPAFHSARRYIGSVSEWRPLLIAFERFRQIELLDHAEALYLLSDLVLHQKERQPAACTSSILLKGVPKVGILLDASLLPNLASGCRELLLMVKHDRFDAFRGTICDGWPSRYGHEPLLSDDADHAVRSLASKIISLIDNDTAPCLKYRLESQLRSPEMDASRPPRHPKWMGVSPFQRPALAFEKLEDGGPCIFLHESERLEPFTPAERNLDASLDVVDRHIKQRGAVSQPRCRCHMHERLRLRTDGASPTPAATRSHRP